MSPSPGRSRPITTGQLRAISDPALTRQRRFRSAITTLLVIGAALLVLLKLLRP